MPEGDSVIEWPEWWPWPLELTAHILRRMRERGFSETDLRRMLEDIDWITPGLEPGRWVAGTSLDDIRWEVILEPDFLSKRLVVVTAYPVHE